MGGEVSKLIGESGERIAKYIFEEIFGYENNLNGTEIEFLIEKNIIERPTVLMD